MDYGYFCVDDCAHPPFPLRKGLTIHQRTCQKYLDHEKSLAVLSVDSEVPLDDLGPSPKRRRTYSPSPSIEPNQEPDPNDSFPNVIAPASPAAPMAPVLAASQRTTRAQARRLDTQFRLERDALPEAPTQPLPLPPPPNAPHASAPTRPANRSQPRLPYRTAPDVFGRYRVYSSQPPIIPDADTPMAYALPITETPPASHCRRPISDIIAPCPNISVFYVLRYHWLSGNSKSLNDREYLCNEVLLQPDFNPHDLIGVNLNDVDNKLAEAAKTWDPNCPPAQGWKNIPLQLQVPPPRVTQATRRLRSQPCAISHKNFIKISGFRARSLVDLMKKVFASSDPSTFHFDPFEHWWKPPGSSGPAQTLSGEMYTSPAMLRAHREVQNLHIPCDLPRCVAGFMFASDGMQFASFSHVKGWPILCSFGNESKYERCKPTSNTCYQVAHIPTLPDEVQEQIALMHGGKPPTSTLLTHLRRELMHAVWTALLDDEFVNAWESGVVVLCADGILRCVFPRILTYSADYPEKVLLATIRNNGDCLCPRCFVQKSKTSQMGTPSDMRARKKQRIDNEKRRGRVERARCFIYDDGRPVQGKAVEELLKEESYVPTMNAFSHRLRNFKFNIFSCLVVDQLHEVELGVWKSLFKHLIRLLHLSGPRAVTEFNRRFQRIPTFGSTIRLFAENVASMGRIAARDFEDILQNGMGLLRALTSKLGTALRNFAKLTEAMDVRETPKEYARRKKQIESSKASSMTRHIKTSSATRGRQAGTQEDLDGDGRQLCVLNLNTYKMHSLGDYPASIEEYGSTDSFSTQIGELQNRKIKAQYMRTNKRNAVEQMTRVGDITTVLQDMDRELQDSGKDPKTAPFIDHGATESLLDGQPYFMGLKDRSEDMIPNIAMWIANQNREDAVKFFFPQLKRHLLGRIRGTHQLDFDELELAQLEVHQGRMYRHKTLRINYTSYDVLRQQDVLNTATPNCFVVLPTEVGEEPNPHPFIYAKVLGVYHAKIAYCGRPPQRMDFVHVRWMYYDYKRPGGWEHRRLDRLTYLECHTDEDILDSFDFIDPSNIVRAVHLLPDFQSGTTKDLLNLKTSIAYDSAEYGDWNGYYVNRFADRDMLMRYIGGGVGHYRQSIGRAAVNMDEIDEVESNEQYMHDNARAYDHNDDGTDEGETDEGRDCDEPRGDRFGQIHDAEDEAEDENEEDEAGEDENMDEAAYDEESDGDATDVGDVEWDDLYEF